MEAASKINDELLVMEGTIKKILWKNEGDNTVIASVTGDNIPADKRSPLYPKDFVTIGTFLRLSVGQRVILNGRWSKDKQGRWRFLAVSHTDVLPTSREGMVDYLSSGLFKGVGKKTAQEIVRAFGTNALDVIRNDPQRLHTVKGIAGSKAAAIISSYREAEHLERLMLSLRQYHIPTAKIVRISQFYGDSAMDRIIENPYRLCDDIEGISFKTADSIARVCNVEAGDDFRVRAGVIYTLNECANAEGHVYLPFELLVTKTQKNLQEGEISGEVSRNDITRVCVDMNNAKELVVEQDGSVYLPLFHGSEVLCGKKVHLLTQKAPKSFRNKVDETVTEMQKLFGIKYAKKQKEAFHTLPTTNMMVITGGPGTGKTTIIKGMIHLFKRNFPGAKIILAAPTGRAAKRMEEATKLEAKTIHRTLEYRPQADGSISCGKDEKNPIDADLIILDECSMLDLLLFTQFLKAVHPDTTLVMVGDIDQLPSVGAGNVLKDIISSKKVPVVFLNEIFRQADTSKIIINAAHINNGKCYLEYNNSEFQFIEENDPLKIPELIKREFKKAFAEVRDINEIQVLTPFRKKTENGVEQLNTVLQEDLNPKAANKPELAYRNSVFRRYDKIMQYRNNYDKEVYNGDVGIVNNVNAVDGTVLAQIGEDQIEYARDELDEIQLAYATTIHKSQGCEYHTVIIPVTSQHKRMLQRNLLYTGVTRAKQKVILIGEKKALHYAILNDKINGRFSKLFERIR